MSKNEFVEQISVVPQATEKIGRVVLPVPSERIHERIVEQISVVPQITENFVESVFGLPQECVQNRATYTGKVFTVGHHFDDQACTIDNVGFTKGLDKHNMPRLGDVMVSAPQITKGIVGHVEKVGFLVRPEITGCCGRAFVSFPTKAPGP